MTGVPSWIKATSQLVPTDPREVALAPGRYRVFATRGPEYEVNQVEIELRADESSALEIETPKRAFDTPGWISADLHVHAGPSFDSSFPLEGRVRSFVAQGGEVVVSTEHNTVADYGPVIRELGLEGVIASVVGTEITSTASTTAAPHTIGHSNAFPVTERPLVYRRGALQGEGRRLRDVVRQVHAVGPETLLQLNHPRNPLAQPGGDHYDTADYFTHLAVAGEFDAGGAQTRTIRIGRAEFSGANTSRTAIDHGRALPDADFEVDTGAVRAAVVRYEGVERDFR